MSSATPGQVVVGSISKLSLTEVHTFNLGSLEAEAGESMSLRPSRSTE